MASLNRVMLIGNAGRDAELRYTQNGTAQAQFSLAVSYKSKGSETTEWVNVVLYGDTFSAVSPYITKGKGLYVEGRLQTRSWEDDSGQKRFKTEVIGNAVQLLGSANEARTQSARPQEDDVDADDLPFE